MKTFLKGLLIICLVSAATAGLIWQNSSSEAATTNPSSGSSGYETAMFPITSVTGTTTGMFLPVAPWPLRVGCFYVVANSVTGPVTVDLKNSAGASLLSSAVTLSTVKSEATLTTNSSTLNIADETVMSINTTGTGTATYMTVTMCVRRR